MTFSIPVFYTPKMVADSLSFSPSASKPKYVVAAWQKLDIQIAIEDVPPIKLQDLILAHDEHFVRGVLTGNRENGFDNKSMEVAESLLYTNASMRDAAIRAIENKTAAVSPTSGFHHAHYNMASAYCTFNGLMVAVQYLLKNNMAKKIGIIDCDYHYGNGTDHLIKKLNLFDKVKHFTAGNQYIGYDQAAAFFKRLPSVVKFMDDCDVILYQAGADPHIDDPLGGFLTTEELYKRDLLVFQLCKEYKLPVAWNLAGGYQQTDDGEPDWDALTEIHNNTMRACCEVYGDNHE